MCIFDVYFMGELLDNKLPSFLHHPLLLNCYRRLTAEPYKMSAGVRYDNIREKFFETEYISLEDFSYGLLV